MTHPLHPCYQTFNLDMSGSLGGPSLVIIKLIKGIRQISQWKKEEMHLGDPGRDYFHLKEDVKKSEKHDVNM